MVDPLNSVDDALRDGTCLLLVLSKAAPGSRQSFAAGSLGSTPATQLPLQKVCLRPVVVRSRPLMQIERHFATNVVHENVEPEQAVALVRELFPSRFEHAALFTPDRDSTLRVKRDGSVAVSSGSPTRKAADTGHNREKAYLITDGVACPFLVEIGVMTTAGQVRAAKYHKFRQINRYLELVNDVAASLPKDQPLRVVDFGCGKSYLTFALHHLLTAIHGREATIVGIDRRKDVVQDCSRIAEKLGCRGLTFRVGDIESHTESERVDLAVSLHACDIATDAALAKAIRWGCEVILAVPCCHHELARQLESAALAPLLSHGILQHRLATSVTDALRARVLDLCGYATQVVEFIDLEHTPQNILLRAVRRRGLDPHRAAKLEEYSQLKEMLRVSEFALERYLGDEGIEFP